MKIGISGMRYIFDIQEIFIWNYPLNPVLHSITISAQKHVEHLRKAQYNHSSNFHNNKGCWTSICKLLIKSSSAL